MLGPPVVRRGHGRRNRIKYAGEPINVQVARDFLPSPDQLAPDSLQYARSLPGVTEEPHFQYSSFRVCGKIFLTVPPREQHLRVFLGEEHREPALAMYSDFMEKLTWGKKVVGLCIELAKAKPAVVRALIFEAWRAKASKSLLLKTSSAIPRRRV